MRRYLKFPFLPVLAIALVLLVSNDTAEGDDKRDVGQWLAGLSQEYAENAWIEKPKFRPLGYMRPTNDRGWQFRMLALRAVVTQGKPAIPKLVQVLQNGDDPQRVFAAQALGYFGVDAPQAPLRKAAQHDESKAVRLYAVDSLGMRGGGSRAVDWDSLRKGESDRDVLKHIGYAVERKDAAIEDVVIASLKNWDPQSINSAVVGQPAPDFELLSATNEKVRLSEFRNKKSVVLVFVYGDT